MSKASRPSTSRRGETLSANARICALLADRWIHQDNLLWGRLRTLLIAQGAAVAAWYSVLGPHWWMASCAAALGAYVSFITRSYALRDAADRKHTLGLYEKVRRSLVDGGAANPGPMLAERMATEKGKNAGKDVPSVAMVAVLLDCALGLFAVHRGWTDSAGKSFEDVAMPWLVAGPVSIWVIWCSLRMAKDVIVDRGSQESPEVGAPSAPPSDERSLDTKGA